MSEVVIVGNGGREHEFARVLNNSPEVNWIYADCENPGIAMLPKVAPAGWPATDYKPETLVFIGPEAPLISGLADDIRARGGLVFGPSAAAARLEGSKAFGTDFVQRYGIASPKATIISSKGGAESVISSWDPNSFVIKADGLASGKGVILPSDREQAATVMYGMLNGALFGEAGKTIVLQERLHGPEISVFVVSDGTDFIILPFARDHKRLKDNDEGPNTGGMGAIAPLDETIVSKDQMEKIYTMAATTIEGMKRDGIPFSGCLFMGIMLAEEYGGDPVVIEYNVRFGDPETQVVLPVFEQAGGDTYGLLRSAAEGKLDTSTAPISYIGAAAVTTCLAADGYPERPITGDAIEGLDNNYPGVFVHYGATKWATEGKRRIITSGGRALYVTGLGESIQDARAKAYAAIGKQGIHFAGMQYRKQIGLAPAA